MFWPINRIFSWPSSWSWTDQWVIYSFLTITMIVILYERFHRFRYVAKFVLYVLVCSLLALFSLPIFLLKFRKFRDVENSLWVAPVARLICPVVGIKWEITGKEHLAKQFSAVVVSNHQSAWDFLLICELWSTMRRCACVAKRAIMYVFPFGLSSWLCGTVFIDRNNAADSRTKISTTAEEIRTNKTKMWIFPEGTRSKRAELLPFKKGAFHIAVQNKLPIIPVVVSPYTFINDERMIFNSGKVMVSVMPPVETEGCEDVSKLVDQIREDMNREYMRLSEVVTKEAGRFAVNTNSPPPPEPLPFENGKRRS